MMKNDRIVLRVTMKELIENLKVEEGTNIAMYEGKKIDGFYYRSGYDPSHFLDERYWKVKEDIERSESVKVPSIEMMIMNTKTMQAKFR